MTPSKITTAPSRSVRTAASSASRSMGVSTITASGSLMAASRELVADVGEELVEHQEAVAHPAGRPGEVDDDGVAGDARDRAAERRRGGRRATGGADRLGDAGEFAIDDGEGRLGRAVLRVHARAPG